MNTIENLPRPALLAIGEAVDIIVEINEAVAHGYGDLADLNAYTNHLDTLCAEHGIDPDEAMDTFA